MVESLGDGILQAALSINGMLGGPTLAIFFMGALMPPVNKWGAHIGWFVGASLAVWTYIGSQIYPPSGEQTRVLPRSTYRYENNYTASPKIRSPKNKEFSVFGKKDFSKK